MKNTDVTSYFESLKKDMKKTNRKKGLKAVFVFIILAASMLAMMYIHLFDNTIEKMISGKDNVFFVFVNGIILTFAAMLYFLMMNTFNPTSLSKEEDINLYSALDFIFKKEKKSLSEKEFYDFKNIIYEKEKIKEILNINIFNLAEFEQRKKKIEYLYNNRGRMVTREFILHKEYFHGRW